MQGIADVAFHLHRACRAIAVHPGSPRDRLRSVAEQLASVGSVRNVFTAADAKGAVGAKLLDEILDRLALPRTVHIAPGTVAEWNVDTMTEEEAVTTIKKLFHADWCVSFFPDDPYEGPEDHEF